MSEAARTRFVTRLRNGAQRMFLEAYHDTASDLPGLRSTELLDLFLIEKAAYEVTYEAANRPNWLSIPLGGLYRLANRILDGK